MRELYNYRIDETYSPTTKKELQGVYISKN